MPKVTTKKFTSLGDLYQRAAAGEVTAQKVCVGALTNLGCDHLASEDPRKPKWQRYHHGFYAYLESMVGEYGIDEGKAEKDLLAEINMARGYSDDVNLED